MEPEQEEAWRELERSARAWLAEPPRRQRHAVALHAVVLPSFEDGCACMVLVPGPKGGGTPLGVRRVWRRGLDAAKFAGPLERLKHGLRLAPTLGERDVELAGAAVDELVRRAAEMRVPAHARGGFGVDGTSHARQRGESFTVARFQWWSAPPPGWEGLAELASELSDLIEGELA